MCCCKLSSANWSSWFDEAKRSTSAAAETRSWDHWTWHLLPLLPFLMNTRNFVHRNYEHNLWQRTAWESPTPKNGLTYFQQCKKTFHCSCIPPIGHFEEWKFFPPNPQNTCWLQTATHILEKISGSVQWPSTTLDNVPCNIELNYKMYFKK